MTDKPKIDKDGYFDCVYDWDGNPIGDEYKEAEDEALDQLISMSEEEYNGTES